MNNNSEFFNNIAKADWNTYSLDRTGAVYTPENPTGKECVAPPLCGIVWKWVFGPNTNKVSENDQIECIKVAVPVIKRKLAHYDKQYEIPYNTRVQLIHDVKANINKLLEKHSLDYLMFADIAELNKEQDNSNVQTASEPSLPNDETFDLPAELGIQEEENEERFELQPVS